jgi:hypothetical protein
LSAFAVGAFLTLSGAFRGSASGATGADMRAVDALFRGNDPIARNITLVAGYIHTYRNFRGRVATPAQMREEGLWFFELTNPYTGTPLGDGCEHPTPGDYSIKVLSSYTLEKLVFYDRNGNEISYPGLRNWTIPPSDRDKPESTLFAPFLQRQPTDAQIKAFFLGRLFKWIFWDLPAAKDDDGAGFLSLLSQPPFNRLNDTLTGQTLPFDGSGYGDRVKFTRSEKGTWFLTIYLPDGEIGYREEFNLVATGANRMVFSALRVPALTSGSAEPPTF